MPVRFSSALPCPLADAGCAVVENFSFVFQVYGRVKSLNREQLRSFKKVWAEFDTERSGYLPRRDLVRFLGVSTSSSTASPPN